MKKQSLIKKVLDKRQNEKEQFEYLIEWKNDQPNSWVPILNLKNELELLADYEVEVEMKNKKASLSTVEQTKTSEKQEKPIKKRKPLMKDSSSSSEEQNEEYEVEEILEKKIKKGVVNYKVKWKGYPISDCTWEPEKHLTNAKKAVAAFQEKQKKFNEEIEETKKESEKPSEGKRKNLKPIKKIRKEMEEEIIEPIIPSDAPILQDEIEEKFQLEIEEQFEISEKGDFKTDEPDKIISAKPSDDILMMTVSWKPRKNGFIAKDSLFTNKEILQQNPKLLVEFYESKLKFVPQQKNKDAQQMKKPIFLEDQNDS